MKKKLGISILLIILITSLAFSQTSLTPGVLQTLQAEDATLSNAETETIHSGYTGSSYVNFANQTGSYLEWLVYVPSASTADCAIVFANGGSAGRPMNILVNGSVVANNIGFPGTGDWTAWSQTNVTFGLAAGNNTIRLLSSGSEGGPNVDKMDITVGGGSVSTKGDVNDDGIINIIDALMTAQRYVGLTPQGFNADAADVNCDNNINIIDALQIAQFYVGLITKFACPTVTNSPAPIITPTPTPTPTPTSGTTAIPNSGIIRITDRAPGWASVSGGTTGGGTNMGIAVTVSSMSDLKSKTSGSGQKIVLVKPGNYSGTLSPGANTTIIGTAPGVTIKGNVSISGSDKKNIIIRNIAIRGNSCGSYDDCKSGSDAVYIGNSANHIWFDHVDIADGQDGNFDVTKSGDFVTASWTKFHYTYNKEHKFSNLIAGSDSETQSRGKLNITYMYCWWGDRVEQRQPRGRFGKIHCFNNLYTSQNTSSNAYHLGPGVEMAMIIENNYFTSPGTQAIQEWGSSKGWKATGNEGTADGMNSSKGSVFDVPYDYTLIPASQVQATVSASVGGAGNTCTFQQ